MPNLEPLLALHGYTVFIGGLLIAFAIALVVHTHTTPESQKGAKTFITVLMSLICLATLGTVGHEMWKTRNLTKAMYLLQADYVSIGTDSGDIILKSGDTTLIISGSEVATLKANPQYAEVVELALLK